MIKDHFQIVSPETLEATYSLAGVQSVATRVTVWKYSLVIV